MCMPDANYLTCKEINIKNYKDPMTSIWYSISNGQ